MIDRTHLVSLTRQAVALGISRGAVYYVPRAACGACSSARARMSAAAAIADAGVTNVELLDPVSRAQLIEEYRSADVLFLHLNDYEAFKKVLPSKVFEYAAMGKPVWAGVAGYSAEFIKTEVSNAAVFPPCDAEAAIAACDTLKQQTAPRESVAQKYARRAIMSELAADMLRFLKPTPRT